MTDDIDGCFARNGSGPGVMVRMELMRQNDNILSLTVQTMTYTGQGGGQMCERMHIPVDEAVRKVCRNAPGILEFSDFFSRPSSHPLCYLTCYLLKSGDQ